MNLGALLSLTLFSAKFAVNVANLAETKSWYGEGTEEVWSGSSSYRRTYQ